MKVSDPGLVDEVSMVVAATGRRLVRQDDLGAVSGLVLVTDARDGQEIQDLQAALGVPGPLRTVRVTGTPFAGGPREEPGQGPTGQEILRVPEESQRLAAVIGRQDPVDIAVAGVVGGAGTSVFAAALAGVLSLPEPGGAGQSLLVDEDPLSRPGQLRLLLGMEGEQDGQDGPVTWAQDVGVVEGAALSGVCTMGGGDPSRPVVRDRGRLDVGRWQREVAGTPLVVVVPQTVPAVLAARQVVQEHGQVHVVLRELPRSGLTWNQTLSLLGRAPTVTWEDDPFLTVDVDRGDFRTTGGGAGTAATAAMRLWEEIR